MTAQRDLVGYADRLPQANWPGNARVAINMVLNYEEGSEYTIGDGDGRNELGLAEVPGGRVPAGARDLAFESMYEFGSRVGVWRIHELFRQRGLPLTVFGCALALERNPRATWPSKACMNSAAGSGSGEFTNCSASVVCR